jgi:ferredoxin
VRCFYTRAQDEKERQRFTAMSVPQDLIDRRARFYICGSPAALRATRDALQERGVPGFEIFEERFQSPSAAPLDDTGAPRRIKLARSGREVMWKAPGSILDVLAQHGVSMPSGCRVGQCESCAVRLLQGTVRYVDAPEDLDEGLCLTCTATPVTDIVLDA